MRYRVVALTLSLGWGVAAHCAAQATGGMDNKHAQYWQTHKGELKVEKNAVEIPPDQLPQKIQKTLDGNDLYKGWKYSPLYFNAKANLYTLYVKKDSTITSYGFNDNGKVVTYDSYTIHEE